MIDNFELIKPLLTFPNDDIYYHLQILRRGKDHPELLAANRLIKSYFIIDINDLDFYEQEIKGEEPKWIVNCDNMSLNEIEKVYSHIKNCDGNTIEDFSVIIPTKSGYHLITEPFNLQQFKEKYPNIDVHKNNPTLLYCL